LEEKLMLKKMLFTIVTTFALIASNLVFAANFSSSDIAGEWYAYSIEINPNQQAVYWVRGKFEVEDSGMLTAGTLAWIPTKA
jgi:hypothetical protein